MKNLTVQEANALIKTKHELLQAMEIDLPEMIERLSAVNGAMQVLVKHSIKRDFAEGLGKEAKQEALRTHG